VNLTRFNKAKCRDLHVCRGNPCYQYRLGKEGIYSSLAKEDLGVLVDEKLDMSWQCVLAAQKATCILGCILDEKHGQQVKRGDSAPLLRSGETLPEVLYPALEPPAQEEHGAVEVGPKEATKTIPGLENLSYEERLRLLGLFSLEKRRLQGDLMAAFLYLKGPHRKDGDNSFSRACCNRTSSNGFKLREGI